MMKAEKVFESEFTISILLVIEWMNFYKAVVTKSVTLHTEKYKGNAFDAGITAQAILSEWRELGLNMATGMQCDRRATSTLVAKVSMVEPS